jgi:ferrous iron transport protein B
MSKPKPQPETAVPTSETAKRRALILAVGGNPNSGKTTLFNRLTGLRQKVANYAGATVEKKTGIYRTASTDVQLIDLPGTYGLTPKSEEERIAAEIILGLNKEISRPHGVLCVVDSTCLEKSLYLVLQVIETGIPAAVLLNMSDELELRGAAIDSGELSRILGVPVLMISATKGTNLKELESLIDSWPHHATAGGGAVNSPLPSDCPSTEMRTGIHGVCRVSDCPSSEFCQLLKIPSLPKVAERRRNARDIASAVLKKPLEPHPWSDKVDAVVMHKFWGSLLFAAIVMLVFQAIFSWAQPFMNLIDSAFSAMAGFVRYALPAGFWRSFLSDGIVAGVGSVVVFLPQILVVFFFISVLENFGYLPRAAAAMDRILHSLGLHGKSFLPLISSYACAIPGIMATRTIENRRDRLATIFVAPFMTCSARLPVYALLISAFVPDIPVFGRFFRLRALTLLGLYAAGFVAAMVTALAMKSSWLKSNGTPFFLEMPPYRIPDFRSIFLHMWDRSKVFLQQAGTVILAVNIILWFLVSYPKKPGPGVNGIDAVRHSYAGRIGTFIEPAIKPLGFDWKIGVGLLSAQAAREVIISTLTTIYSVEEQGEKREGLQKALQKDMTPLTAVSLMFFFAFALQCSSTLAVAHRETGGWKIPALMFLYMNCFAYAASFAVYHLGLLFGHL